MRIVPLAALLAASGCVAPLASLTRVSPVTAGAMRFELHSEPEAVEDTARVRGALERATPLLERWGGLAAPVTIRIAPTHDALERAVNRRGYDWLRAWAQYDELIIQAPGTWAGTDRDVDELVVHELTHCLLFQRSGTRTTWNTRRIPLWFREGMATVTADQGLRFPSLEDLADWVQRNPGADPFEDGERLSREAYGPTYGVAYHAMRFLLRRHGDAVVLELMRGMRAGDDFEAAFIRAVGTTPRRFAADFLNYLRFRGFRGFGLKVRPRLQPAPAPP